MGWKTRLVIGGMSLTTVALLWHRWQQSRRPAPPDPQSLIIMPDDDIIVERPTPQSLTIRWRDHADSIRVYLSDTPDGINHNHPDATAKSTRSITISDVSEQRRTYGEIVLNSDGSTRTLPIVERVVPLRSVPNFRDIGGYRTRDGQRVRWHMVYRASSLAYLSTDDHHHLDAMNIQTVCDLRTEDEIRTDPDRLPDHIRYHALSPTSNDNRWKQLGKMLFQHDFIASLLPDLYTRVLIDQNPHVFGTLFRQLANANHLPLIIHCTAGKDRTGIAIALLLGLLGVPDETILADYTLSNHHVDYFAEKANKVLAQLQYVGLREEDLMPLLVADADVMQTTLAHIRMTYGSISDYLRDAAGVTDTMQTRIRANLLEPIASSTSNS